MVLFTKIIAVLFALMVIFKTFHDYKKKQENVVMFLFWTIAWILIAYVALKPALFYTFVTHLSSEKIGMGTFVGIAFIFLFFIVYRVYIKANRLERQIKDIVMKIGIKDIIEEIEEK